MEILTCMRAIEPVTTGNDGSEKPLVLVRRNEKNLLLMIYHIFNFEYHTTRFLLNKLSKVRNIQHFGNHIHSNYEVQCNELSCFSLKGK